MCILSVKKKMTFIYPTKARHFSLCRNDELLSYCTSMVIPRKGRPGCVPLSVLFLFFAFQTGKVANLIRTILRICPETSL